MTRLLEPNKSGATAVVEDPRPTSNTIYLNSQAYDFNTISPIFSKDLRTSTDGHKVSHFGQNNIEFAQYRQENTPSPDGLKNAGSPGRSLSLSKPCVYVNHNEISNPQMFAPTVAVDKGFLASMDQENYPVRIFNEFSDGTDTALCYHAFDNTMNYYNRLVWNGDEELYDQSPVHSEETNVGHLSTTTTTETVAPRYYFGIDNATKNVYGLGELIRRDYDAAFLDQTDGPHGFAAVALTNFPTLSTDVNAGSVGNYFGQFLGVTDTGNCLYFLTHGSSDINQKVYNYAVNNNTGSYLQEWSSDRPAANTVGGTSVGGSRSMGTGFGYQHKVASSIFDDPDVANTKGFYVPYIDTDQNYHPYYFQWDQTNNSFTRNEDISVVQSSSSNTLSASSDYFFDAGETSIYRWRPESRQSIMFNETFVVNSTRYLTFGVLNNVYRKFDDADHKRTWITYEIDANDPKRLIYHSNVTISATPRGFVWLNDEKTFFGIVTESAFFMYSFNETTGWENSGTVNKQFWAVGRDRSDRIFGVASHPSNYVEIHLITPSLPIVVNITAENTSYDYQGSVITSYVEVDAVNAEGNRVSTDVTLVIEGSTMTFDDDSTSKVVTTSNSATVQVPIKITDAGFSRIISSVTV
jgi:hypothetical protein